MMKKFSKNLETLTYAPLLASLPYAVTGDFSLYNAESFRFT